MNNEPEVLFSESGHIGTEEVDDPLFEYKIMLYIKVGGFFHWSWQDFEATDLIVVERLAEEIDFRLENITTCPYLLTWESMGVYFAIVKAMGGFKHNQE